MGRFGGVVVVFNVRGYGMGVLALDCSSSGRSPVGQSRHPAAQIEGRAAQVEKLLAPGLGGIRRVLSIRVSSTASRQIASIRRKGSGSVRACLLRITSAQICATFPSTTDFVCHRALQAADKDATFDT